MLLYQRERYINDIEIEQHDYLGVKEFFNRVYNRFMSCYYTISVYFLHKKNY